MKSKHNKTISPTIHRSAAVDRSARIIGSVRIGRNVFVGPGAVIRADEPKSIITIKDNCNIQDNVIVHALAGSSVIVEKESSLSHGSIVHGPCSIGKKCFIGFGSVVFRSSIGDGSIIKHLAVVEGVNIPSGRVVPSGAVVDSKETARGLKKAPADLKKFSRKVTKMNLWLAKNTRDWLQ